MSGRGSGRVSGLVRKLRGRTLDEVRVRGAQAVAAWRERSGRAGRELHADPARLAERLAGGAPCTAEALLAGFRARGAGDAAPRFFATFDDPAATVAALRAHCPGDEPAVVARAARVLAGRFDLLGYTGLDYGRPPDWHRDPVAGRGAPADAHWSRVPYLDHAAVGDHKVVWEVNRQQYLVTLGQAYWYTGDARYADAFAEHVDGWMAANPPKRGINWASSLEVAFRAMAWTWALHFFRHSPALTPERYARLLGYLHVHARHLETYLSTYFSPNTHLTGEALGLVHVGALFPELAGAARWQRAGLDVLRAWLPRQVRADGGYFEQATQYHRYTTEFTLHLLVLDARHGWGLAAELRPVLARLFDFLQAVTRPDGTIPLVGDDDGGKLVWLDGLPPDDVRPVLAQGAAWLGDPALARAAGDAPEALAAALWLFGPDAAARLDALRATPAPAARSRAFADSGFYVMRDDAGDDVGPGAPPADAPTAAALHAVIDCGPHGVMNFGHAHADALSLVASAGGRPLLVDSGTYSYPGPERNAFRGAAAHNVVLVDGQGSSEPAAGAFQWARVAHGRALAWEAGEDFAWFEGTHDGFAALADPVAYRRAVLFLPGMGWVVRDRIEAVGEHVVRAHWHLAPGVAPARSAGEPDTPGTLVAVAEGRPALVVAAFGGGRELALAAEPAWYSPRYGARVATTRLVAEARLVGSQDIVTYLLVPAALRSTPAVRVERAQARCARFLTGDVAARLPALVARARRATSPRETSVATST